MVAATLLWRTEVIVADVAMPDMDEIEAARQLRRLAFRGVLVFVSMNNDREIVKAAFSVGVFAYVLKIKAGTEPIPAIREALHLCSNQLHIYLLRPTQLRGPDASF